MHSLNIEIRNKNIELESAFKIIDTTNRDLEKSNILLDAKNTELLNTNNALDSTNNELSIVNRSLDERNAQLEKTIHQMKINQSRFVSEKAMQLVEKLWDGNPLRSLTVSTANLIPVSSNIQESLFELHDERKQSLEIAIDQIRKKYGFFAIKKANLLGNDLVCDKFSDDEDLIPFKRQ